MCPVCREPMVVFELDGVEIDRCLKCKGTWLDAGEIDQLARLEGGRSDRMSAEIASAPAGTKGERRCIRCSARMIVARVRQVEIDRCPRGHGVWFDRDEIEALISAFRAEDATGMARFLGEFHPPGQSKGG